MGEYIREKQIRGFLGRQGAWGKQSIRREHACLMTDKGFLHMRVKIDKIKLLSKLL